MSSPKVTRALQAASLALCRHMLWTWPGMYAWLLAATRKPISAIASYDAEAALKLCLAFGRTGISTSHFRTLSTPAKVRNQNRFLHVTRCDACCLL